MFQYILRLCMHRWFLYVVGLEANSLKRIWKILNIKDIELNRIDVERGCTLSVPDYVYWTVHYCGSWRIRDQLDVTNYSVLFHFFYAQHVSDINTSIIRSLRLFYFITTLVVCSCFDVCWSFGVVGLGWCPCCRLQPATRIFGWQALQERWRSAGFRQGMLKCTCSRGLWQRRTKTRPTLWQVPECWWQLCGKIT